MKVGASLAITGLMLSDAAGAQRATEIDTRSRIPVPQRAIIPDRPGLNEARRGRIVLAEFARCVVDRKPAAAARAVGALSTADYDDAVRAAMTDQCLDTGMMRFGGATLRGPLFVELYRRRAAAEARQRRWGPPAPKIDPAATGAGSIDEGRLPLLSFGQCIVTTAPEAARAIVLAPTGSSEQGDLMAKAGPTFGACVPRGTTLNLDKKVVEVTLAEVLYRGVEPSTVGSVQPAEAK